MQHLNTLIKYLIRPLLVTASMIMLSSCSNYTFTTNVDKQNFTNYFATGAVTVYENNEKLPALKEYIGMVDGESCQASKDKAPASKVEARTAARKKAYKLTANAVVFTGCASEKTKQCQQLIICYAQAYKVKK